MEIKFLKYEETPNDKSKGVATVVYNNNILLRYKVMPGKDGKGIFIVPPSMKINEEFYDTFTIDSNIAKEEIISIIRKNITKAPIQTAPFSSEDIPF